MIIGFFLLRNWDGTGVGGGDLVTEGAASSDQAGGDAGSTGSTVPGAETTTTVPPRVPSEITVRVLNATDVVGAAGKLSETLQEGSYKTVEPDDAPVKLEASKILFAAGFEREAAELAAAISSPAEAIEPLTDQVDPQGANLVVLLGNDLAGSV